MTQWTLLVGIAVLITAGMPLWASVRRGAPVANRPPPLRNLYVSTRGDDKNDGLSPEIPFRTISRAADVVEPGDLVHVAGGTYFEHVHLTRPGTAEHPIVFRAEAGETALVTFGQKLPGWRKVEGSRFVYALSYDHPPVYVWEDRSVTRYVGIKNAHMLDELPGSYLFDRTERRLYVHPLRGLSPEDARIIVVPATDESSRSVDLDQESPNMHDGGFLHRAPHNRVEGFTIAYQPVGVDIRADFCEVANNVVYGCLGGITLRHGNDCVIEDNISFRNDSHGIVAGRGSRVIVRNNQSRDNGPAGPFAKLYPPYGMPKDIAVYGLCTDISFTGNTIIMRSGDLGWRYKSPAGKIVTTHNVIVGGSPHMMWGDEADYSFNTVIGGVLWSRQEPREEITPEVARKHNAVAMNNIFLEKGLQADSGFADAARHDYRLRLDSPFVGSGAFPEPVALRYVSPEGDDSADGRTPKTAWKTLTKAAAEADPGDTVYVLAGTYAESVTISTQAAAELPLVFRTYGRGSVVLDGGDRLESGLVLTDAQGVTLDGFILRGYTGAAVRIERSRDIGLAETVVDDAATAVSVRDCNDVRLLNCTLLDCDKAVEARGGEGKVTIRNTLLAGFREAGLDLDRAAAQGLVSERNAFAPAATAVVGILAGRSAASVENWTALAAEAHQSLLVTAEVSAPDYLLPIGSKLAFRGLQHKPIGARGGDDDESPVVIEGFKTASILPEQAVLTWSTPFDYAAARLTWEGPQGAQGSVDAEQDETLKRVRMAGRITNLAPGGTYRVTLKVSAGDVRSGQAELSFETPETLRAPAMLHVAVDGKDENDGTAPESALRTLAAASLRAVPGDTVLVHPGVYAEKLRLWCGGLSKEKPLTFRSTERGEAVIDLGRVLPGAIAVENLSHIVIDGFRIKGVWYAGATAVGLKDVTDVWFTHNFFEPPEHEESSSTLLDLVDCRDVVIARNSFVRGFNGIIATGCDHMVIDHNTFYTGGVNAVIFDGNRQAHLRITNNIFADVMVPKKGNPAVAVYRQSPHLVCDYNLYWRDKSPMMGLFSFRRREDETPISWRDNPKTIEDVRERWSVEEHGEFGDPLFVDADNGDFRLQPGSAALGMADDGSAVGAMPAE
ncbi:MAG: right-handed parallel beta-helix repeat-containing protein [Planctomycetes bacterium]|nr:right-handed parallel beta-helix repeat-containing protein [Planctomycetota bacterium]